MRRVGMRWVIVALVLVWAGDVANADEFVKHCEQLLKIPPLRAKHDKAQEELNTRYRLKMHPMQTATTYLRGDKRVSDKEIELAKKYISEREKRAAALPKGKQRERIERGLKHRRASLRQMEIHKILDVQTTDREAKAKELEARVAALADEKSRAFDTLRTGQKKEFSAVTKSLRENWEGFKAGFAKFIKEPAGDYAGAKSLGGSENMHYLMYARNYKKDGKPQLVLGVSLLGERELPNNNKKLREGIQTWVSNSGGSQSKVVAQVGAFEVRFTATQKDVSEETLYKWLDEWLELDKLRDLPLPKGREQQR